MRGCIFPFCHPKQGVSLSPSPPLPSSSSLFVQVSSSPASETDRLRLKEQIPVIQSTSSGAAAAAAAAAAQGKGNISRISPRCGLRGKNNQPRATLESPSDPSPPSVPFWQHIYWKRVATAIEDLLTMGACMSSGGSSNLIENVDGGEQEYHNRFIEDRVLGEGEFGVVSLVHDTRAASSGQHRDGTLPPHQHDVGNTATMACKTLRKGVVFKDNTLYAPIKPEILQCEVNILRNLKGECYCCKFQAVYETPRVIFLVTEFCAGGDMMEYVSKQEEDLRTDDVSRISFQLLSAVDHCAKHQVIHRDIKPENVMFSLPTPGSDMRLIDFGSGTDKVVEGNHTTFAGSAFYISPEMYQRIYTQKTDVWSAAVALYVLVAGYPADKLQKAFNLLHCNQRNLRDLPNLPDDMPDSFYDMLDGLLVYKHKLRKSAGDMLSHEFVQFHKSAFSVENIMLEAAKVPDGTAGSKSKTLSMAIRGSVRRHSMFLDFQNYERSLTTLLATLLSKKELSAFVESVHERLAADRSEKKGDGTMVEESGNAEPSSVSKLPQKTMDIIKVKRIKGLLEEAGHTEVLGVIQKLPGANLYDAFAYDVGVLHYFVGDGGAPGGGYRSQTGSNRQSRISRNGGGSFSGSLQGSLRGSFRGKPLFGNKRQTVDASALSVGGKPTKLDSAPRENSNSRGRASMFEMKAMKRSRSR